MWFLPRCGSKLWGSSAQCPPPALPHARKPRRAAPQRGTRFLPHCDTPLPAACVTPLPAQSAGAAAHPRPGPASTFVPSPALGQPGTWQQEPRSDAGQPRHRRQTGFHHCCQCWKIGWWPRGPLCSLSGSVSHHPARAGDGKGTASTPRCCPNPPWQFEGGRLGFQLSWWREEGPKQAQGHPCPPVGFLPSRGLNSTRTGCLGALGLF